MGQCNTCEICRTDPDKYDFDLKEKNTKPSRDWSQDEFNESLNLFPVIVAKREELGDYLEPLNNTISGVIIREESLVSRPEYVDEEGNRYHGQWHLDLGVKQGSGACLFAHGELYEGQWINNQPHGDGRSIMVNEVYEGEFKYGKRNGMGVLVFEDGRRYDGEFFNGKGGGQGVMSFPDGSKYEGEFRLGMMQGKGTWYTSQGGVEQGRWHQNVKVVKKTELLEQG